MKARTLITKIIAKGGMLGTCAKLYKDDETQARAYIYEMKQQIQVDNVKKFWGQQLIKEIESFN